MKTREELEYAIKNAINAYKDIIFGSNIPTGTICLDELRKQQIIDKHVHDRKLMDDTLRKYAWEGFKKNIVIDGETLIDKRTGEVLGPEVGYK